MQECDFCNVIYSMCNAPDKNCIIHYDGRYGIQVPDYLTCYDAYVENVKYCPYCGRELFEGGLDKK